MNVKIAKNSVPIHTQLEEQIKQLIWSGQLLPGARLSSVRELESFLRVNRNTVAKAYKSLEFQGFLVSDGAKGTRVAEKPPQPVRQAEVNDFLNEVLRRAGELGLSPEQFSMQLLAHAQATGIPQRTAKILLVECNRPQLEQFKREILNSLPVEVDTLLLEEASQPQLFNKYTAVVTTFFHADEVRELMAGSNAELVTLLLKDNLPTLMRLKQLPRGTRVGLICETEHGLRNYEKSLAGLVEERLRVRGAVLEDTNAIQQVLSHAQVVICSSSVVKEQIESLLTIGVELICDDRSLDSQGIDLLRQRLLGYGAD